MTSPFTKPVNRNKPGGYTNGMETLTARHYFGVMQICKLVEPFTKKGSREAPASTH